MDMNSYELQRLENIKHNRQVLKDLDLDRVSRDAYSEKKPTRKRRKVETPPSRASARIASSTRPIYEIDVSKDADVEVQRRRPRQAKTPPQTHLPSVALGLDVESIRTRWTDWMPSAPPPTRDESGTFHFASHPDFLPNKSPEEVLREGCFGGSYFRPLRSQKLSIKIEDDHKELPDPWTTGLDISRYLTSPDYNPDVNKFKVACGQSIEEWEAAGWINHDYDVRGWFQWYIRFFQGRRCADDDRQVSRWKKCVGESGRWRRMLLKKYRALGVREVFDDGTDEDAPEVSPVMHQTCHHWAFEVRQNVLDDFWSQQR
ncbi:hypothetical protein EPUS_06444 [Endocarpon pusillum Z07020]|uniref:Vegetatible incompatibility protein HET-E-1 n=1 Tax=Endocarpon pusillum (strain Z07020 / HMAS-L-300199) TaxID=1263415 RepID=U1HGT4_ENDPU|nr:uncharacterized protein EPUS_06444 [Endocarpon pusillum Z07020]ERF68054.1 hypothetical protein EPUS_06444 [Endocarpon pusillum Z07020]